MLGHHERCPSSRPHSHTQIHCLGLQQPHPWSCLEVGAGRSCLPCSSHSEVGPPSPTPWLDPGSAMQAPSRPAENLAFQLKSSFPRELLPSPTGRTPSESVSASIEWDHETDLCYGVPGKVKGTLLWSCSAACPCHCWPWTESRGQAVPSRTTRPSPCPLKLGWRPW